MSQFNHQLKLSIVKGIVAGYKEYVEVRKDFSFCSSKW